MYLHLRPRVRISSLSASFSHTPLDVPPSFRDVIDSFSRLIATAAAYNNPAAGGIAADALADRAGGRTQPLGGGVKLRYCGRQWSPTLLLVLFLFARTRDR